MPSGQSFPKALEPPCGKVVVIDDAMIASAVAASRTSPRRRVILPLQKSPSDRLHRMLNAVQPMSYIQPHRHCDPPKAESFLVIQGAVWFFVFGDGGDVTAVHRLAAGSARTGIDIEPGIYHSFAAAVADTVLFEVKTGPYEATSDKDFAPWAPPEGARGADSYLKMLYDLAMKPLKPRRRSDEPGCERDV